MSVSAMQESDQSRQNRMSIKYGVEFFQAGQKAVAGSRESDLYTYQTYFGAQTVTVEKGDTVYHYDHNGVAHVQAGPVTVNSSIIATVIRGYTAPTRSAVVGKATHLPYINGCSTRQIFTPERIGDPTLQLLRMPPFASEQQHHIHSTARVVHVLKGYGRCVVGMDRWSWKTDLVEGMSLILHPTCPHHFETTDESLLVMPLHIFSSPPAGVEFNHPMFNGTHRIG